jgi:hypothetical protein
MASRTRRGSGDALAFRAGLEGGHEALGQAQGEAGGFGPGLPVDLAEPGDVEGGEVGVGPCGHAAWLSRQVAMQCRTSAGAAASPLSHSIQTMRGSGRRPGETSWAR